MYTSRRACKYTCEDAIRIQLNDQIKSFPGETVFVYMHNCLFHIIRILKCFRSTLDGNFSFFPFNENTVFSSLKAIRRNG